MAKNSGNKKPKTFTIKMQARTVLVFCLIVLVFIGLSVRIAYLNYKDGDRYKKRVLSQQIYVSNVIPYKRGDILDRKGTVLATSEKVYSLIMEPKTILSKEEYYKTPTLTALTTCYDFKMEELLNILTDRPTSQYVVLKKKVTYEEMIKFEELAAENRYIKGVWFQTDYERKYPLSTVASDVIGFTNSGNVGNGGIEGYYSSSLNGTNGREYGYFDAELNLEKTVKNAVDGYNVVSTLDADAQRMTEKQIQSFMKETGAENVGVVVMDPNTGEILVMASDKGYDLNNPRDLSAYYSKSEIKAMDEEKTIEALNAIWRNYCISDNYEPGSTWKPMVIAAALEEGTVKQSSEFDCDGKEVILGQKIQCVKRTGHGHINLEETLINSCNDSLMQIGALMGRTTFNKIQRLFGLGSKTGVDLSGEASGIIFQEETLNPIELATSSFGQGLEVNMLQITAAFSSVVNGGSYYQPHVVKEITNASGVTVETKEPMLVRKTITKATAEYIKKALYDTVEQGSGKKAKVDGYLIGGKTGTAQKFPRADRFHLVSFIGCVPYNDPEFVIYVVVDQPDVPLDQQADSSFATVLAGKIMKDILPVLGIYPTEKIPAKTDGEKGDTPEDGQTEGGQTEGGQQQGEQDTTPDDTVPDDTTPDDTAPDGSTPDADAPGSTTADDAAQDGEGGQNQGDGEDVSQGTDANEGDTGGENDDSAGTASDGEEDDFNGNFFDSE